MVGTDISSYHHGHMDGAVATGLWLEQSQSSHTKIIMVVFYIDAKSIP